jgi:hypothetical protein
MCFAKSPLCQYAAVVLLTVFLGLCVWQAPPKFVSDKLEPEDPLEVKRKQLEQSWQARAAFLAYYDQVIDDIAWHGLAPLDAVERIHAYCQVTYPVFLYSMEFLGEETSLREKIARNIVLHVQMEMESGNVRGWPPDLVERLERELGFVAASSLS